MTTVAEVAAFTDELRAEHPDWRKGQSAFNALELLAPDCAESVRGMLIDPFYRDNELPAFWRHVANWFGEDS